MLGRERKSFNWQDTQQTIDGLIWGPGKNNAYGGGLWKTVGDILLENRYIRVLLVQLKNERPKTLAVYEKKNWAAVKRHSLAFYNV